MYDLTGALVNTITAEESPALWDCRNFAGEMVGSGVYFYVIDSEGTTATGRVAIVH